MMFQSTNINAHMFAHDLGCFDENHDVAATRGGTLLCLVVLAIVTIVGYRAVAVAVFELKGMIDIEI